MTGPSSEESEQWSYVREWRERLDKVDRSRRDKVPPRLAALLDAWHSLVKFDRRHLERDARKQTSPLVALMHYVEIGLYPPPELLLGLQECWLNYLDGCGKATLEEEFIGKPKRKGGNYSRQYFMRLNRSMFASWMSELVHEKGMTQEAAAEALILREEGVFDDIDAETVIRIARDDPMYRLKERKRRNKRVINPVKPRKQR